MILSDKDILRLCANEEKIKDYTKGDYHLKNTMLYPFVSNKVRQTYFSNSGLKPIISYGLSSGGYDLRLGTNFKRYVGEEPIDPKNIDEMQWVDEENESPFVLESFGSVLGESLEIINMPEDVIGVALGKSTYARTGLFVNVTPLEPGWKGVLTIEINNLTKNPIWVYPLEGIIQVLFFRFDNGVTNPYNGNYQNQSGVTTSKVGESKNE